MTALTLAAIALLAVRQDDPEAPLIIQGPAPAAPAGWVAFESKDGSFRADFPEAPKQVDRTAPISGGRRAPVVSHEFQTPERGVFMVTYTDYPEGTIDPDKIEALYDRQVAGLAGRGGTLIRQRKTRIGGHVGRDFEAEAKRGEQDTRILVRAVVVGNRAYQVMRAGPADLDRDEAQAFLDSFRPAAPK